MAESGRIVVHEKSPYECLDYETDCFIVNLKGLWQSLRTDPRVVSILQNQYHQSPKPYETVLKLMYNSGDFNSCKPLSLSVFCVTVFSDWVAANKHVVLPVEPQVKIDALKLVLEQKNSSFRNLVIKTFDMVSDKEIFIPMLRELLQRGNYKDVCETVGALGLHSQFSHQDFLLPLYLQDKLVVIEEYLARDRQVLMDFITCMDELMEGDTRSKLLELYKKLDTREIRLGKCEYKPLSKFLLRLIKKFNVSTEICPSLLKRRRKGALHFLMARRFGPDGEGKSDGWTEMVQDAVAGSTELQLDLIRGLLREGFPDEAQYMKDRFEITEEVEELSTDSAVNDIKTPPPNRAEKSPNHKTSSPTTNVPHLRLPLHEDDIIVVDSAELLARFATALDNTDMVGIDCEWKPSFGLTENGLSLIQVALRNEVYILDITALSKGVENYSLTLTDKLFSHKSIIKMGFNLSGDTKAILKAIPDLKNIYSLLDLTSLWQILREQYKLEFPYASEPSKAPSGGKLKSLVQLCLGKTLDKTEQFSNWELRPLRPTQVYYAALDAYCLLEIYDALKQCCEKQRIPLQHVVQGLLDGRSPHCKWERPVVPVTFSVGEVNVVCTWELWLVAKRLRQCGINTVYCNANPTKKIRKLLFGHGFHLLTTRTPTWYSSDFKMCKVPVKEVKVQLQHVLQELSVEVLPQDCGTRCIECNSTDVEGRTRAEMQKIIDAKLQKENKICAYNPELEDNNDDYDDWEDYGDEGDFEPPPPAPINFEDLPRDMTNKGVKIKAENVPKNIIEECEEFQVCQECGEVRWPETLENIFEK